TPDGFLRARGWEEGMVEQLQRVLRGDVVAGLSVRLDEAALRSIDARSAYNGYVAALERLRTALGAETRQWYLEVFARPVERRPRFVREQGEQRWARGQLDEWRHLVREADRVLRTWSS